MEWHFAYVTCKKGANHRRKVSRSQLPSWHYVIPSPCTTLCTFSQVSELKLPAFSAVFHALKLAKSLIFPVFPWRRPVSPSRSSSSVRIPLQLEFQVQIKPKSKLQVELQSFQCSLRKKVTSGESNFVFQSIWVDRLVKRQDQELHLAPSANKPLNLVCWWVWSWCQCGRNMLALEDCIWHWVVMNVRWDWASQ